MIFDEDKIFFQIVVKIIENVDCGKDSLKSFIMIITNEIFRLRNRCISKFIKMPINHFIRLRKRCTTCFRLRNRLYIF